MRLFTDLKDRLFASAELTAWQFVCFGLQLCASVLAACFVPIFFRGMVLPSTIELSTDLDFAFSTCTQTLSGVCSFPTANVSLQQHDAILTPGVQYGITVDLKLSDISVNEQLGVFLVTVEMHGLDGALLGVIPRSAFFKRKSGLFTQMRRLFFLPFYLIGWTNEVEPLQLAFTDRWVDTGEDRETAVIAVQVQNRFVQIEWARLTVTAQLGLLRSVLVNWPLTTSLCIASMTFAGVFSILAIHWIFRAIKAFCVKKDKDGSESEEHYVDEYEQHGNPSDFVYNAQLNPNQYPGMESTQSSVFYPRKKQLFTDNGYVADEDLPECPMNDQRQSPGWIVDSTEIRRRPFVDSRNS